MFGGQEAGHECERIGRPDMQLISIEDKQSSVNTKYISTVLQKLDLMSSATIFVKVNERPQKSMTSILSAIKFD